MAAGKILQIKRGIASGLVTLAAGELGWATDTFVLYVGTGAANKAVLMASQASAAGLALMDDANAAAQLATLGVTAAAKTILDDATVAAILATIGGVANGDARLSDARTPVAHNQAATTINSGVLAIAQIPTGATGTTVPFGNDARFSDARTPVAHNHVKANITDFPASMPASDVSAWAKAGAKPSYTYSEVGAAAASHAHAESDITNLATDLAAKQNILYVQADGVSGSALGFIKENIMFAGATISAMSLVYMGAGGRWLVADADAIATMGFLVFALEAKTDGYEMLVAFPGCCIFNNAWSWTAGQILYASGTAGGITATQPSGVDAVIRVIGYAIGTTSIWFQPDSGYITHT